MRAESRRTLLVQVVRPSAAVECAHVLFVFEFFNQFTNQEWIHQRRTFVCPVEALLTLSIIHVIPTDIPITAIRVCLVLEILMTKALVFGQVAVMTNSPVVTAKGGGVMSVPARGH